MFIIGNIIGWQTLSLLCRSFFLDA